MDSFPGQVLMVTGAATAKARHGASLAGSSGSALFHERPVGFMGKLPE